MVVAVVVGGGGDLFLFLFFQRGNCHGGGGFRLSLSFGAVVGRLVFVFFVLGISRSRLEEWERRNCELRTRPITPPYLHAIFACLCLYLRLTAHQSAAAEWEGHHLDQGP